MKLIKRSASKKNFTQVPDSFLTVVWCSMDHWMTRHMSEDIDLYFPDFLPYIKRKTQKYDNYVDSIIPYISKPSERKFAGLVVYKSILTKPSLVTIESCLNRTVDLCHRASIGYVSIPSLANKVDAHAGIPDDRLIEAIERTFGKTDINVLFTHYD